MNKYRKTAILYYIAAAICYVCSVIWFCNDKGGLGGMWLCIGSANLCLGSVWMKRSNEAESQGIQEKQETQKTQKTQKNETSEES